VALATCPLVAALIAASTLGSGTGLAREAAGLKSVRASTSPADDALGNIRARAAGATAWCGTASPTDRAPNPLAGNPVHWVYVVPSDGQDRQSTVAPLMQADAEAIEAWWRSQDPSRTPRTDLASFACGLQLDVSAVRLSQSGGELAARETPFEQIWDGLAVRGFRSEHAKYVVYYDGPIGNGRICGAGATVPRQMGMAMVFIQSCAGIATSEVAVHELVHALGAVPNGAPHMCPPPDQGHTCDTAVDLMYPYTDGGPLSDVQLDPRRDDYYGHSASWPDVQDSPWLVHLDRQARFSLTISGPGRVVSDVPGLDCSQTCSNTWNAGTRLTLTAVPAAGAKLVRWTGDCSGASSCLATVGEGSSATTALFASATYRVNVRLSGRGSIRSTPPGLACPGRCSSSFASYSPLRLQATPAKGWKFVRWAGACGGKTRVCTLPMTASSSLRAVFTRS
jgi:Divergent InlB B-repeat domain